MEKSAALPFFNAKSSVSFMEGGERYGIPSGKKRQTAWHVLTHRVYLTNAVTNGKPSGGAWFDSDVELMNENMVYGSHIFAPGCDGSTIPTNYTVEKSQLPLFQLAPHLISNRQWFWLRDVVSSACFARVGTGGAAGYFNASGEFGVRPAFVIG